MAAKRVAASVVNWGEMAAKCPAEQKFIFQAFKTKSDNYLHRVTSLPAEVPKIDFAYYRKNVALAGLVDQFEKQYSAVKIPEPTDKNNIMAEIDEYESRIKKNIKEAQVQLEESLSEVKEYKTKLENMPSYEYWTQEDVVEYFPHWDGVVDPKNPTLFPHWRSINGGQEYLHECALKDRTPYGWGRH